MKFIHTESTIIEITENVIDLKLGDTFFKEFSSDQSFTFKNVPTNVHKTLYITAKNGLDSYRAAFKTPLSSFENYAFAACPEWVTKIDIFCDTSGDIQLSVLDIKVYDMGVNIVTTTPTLYSRTTIDSNGYVYGTNGMTFAETGLSFIKKDGTESDALGTGFMSKFDGGIYTIQRSNDNKYIYVGGTFTKFEGTSIRGIARFYADTLTLDRTFIPTVVTSGAVYAISPGTNTVAIGGTFTNTTTYARNIETINSSGSLTKMGLSSYLGEKFSDGVVSNIAISGNYAYISGTFTTYGGQSVGPLIKVNLTDLTLDPTFSTNITSANTTFSGAIYDMKVINSGTANEALYILGISITKINNVSNTSNLVKIKSDGTIDTTFNCALTVYGSSSYPNIEIDPSGNIYVPEVTALNGTSSLGYTIAKINGTTGATDPNFKINSVGVYDVFKAYYNKNDGYIYGIGSFGSTFGTYNLNSSYIVKIDPSTGVPDLNFNIKFNNNVHSLAFDNSNNMYANGLFTSYSFGSGSPNTVSGITKINLTTNTKDSNFSSSNSLNSASLMRLKLASNGDLLIYLVGATSGVITYNSSSYYIARVSSSTGSVLSSVISSLFATTGASYALAEYNSNLLFCNSGTFIPGNIYSYYAVLNNSDGSISSSFVPGSNFNGAVRSIVGNNMFGGDFTTYNGTPVNYLCSISNTGTIINYNANASVRVIVPISDYGDYETYGSNRYPGYFVGGDFTSVLGTTSNKIVAIKNDGTIYSDFNKFGSGFSTTAGHGIYDIKITGSVSSGNINMAAVGLFTTFNGVAFGSAVYLNFSNTSGTATTSSSANYFGTGTAGTVYSVIQDNSTSSSENGLILGGTFTNFNGITTNRHIYFANYYGNSTALTNRFNKSLTAASVYSLFTNSSMSNFYDISNLKTKYFLAGLASNTPIGKNQIFKLNLNKNLPSATDGFLKYGNNFYGALKDGNYVYLYGTTGGSIGAENGWPTTVTIKGLTRINSTTGEVDSTFINFIGTGFTNNVYNVFKLGTYLYVFGAFSIFNGSTYKGVIRINIDPTTGTPTLDTAFNSTVSGNPSFLSGFSVNYGAQTYIASNNSFYVGSNSLNYLYKLNANTSALDSSFLGKTTGAIYDIVNDGTYIYISHNGYYAYNGTNYGTSTNRITKIALDGTYINSWVPNGYVHKMVIDGSSLYVCTFNNAVQKLNISGTNLSEDTSFISPSSSSTPSMYNIFIYGDNLYLISSGNPNTLKNGINKSYICMVNKYTGETKRGLPDLTNF